MTTRPGWPRVLSVLIAVLMIGFGPGFSNRVEAQTPSLPTPAPGPALADSPDTPSVSDLQDQIRQLESLVRESVTRQQQLEARILELESGAPSIAPEPETAFSLAPASADAGADAGTSSPSGFGDRELTRGGAAGLSPDSPLTSTTSMPAPLRNLDGIVKFGPGFQLSTEDDEFTIQFHNLTQVDGRFHEQRGQQNTRDTFGIPRQWFIFNGRLTRPFEYYVAINQGFDNFLLLDAFLNIHYDDRFQIKAGRFKTPFLYEFYSLPANGLISPERSQFFNNFGLNRDEGLMAWGLLFDNRIDYAVGIFNGTRNGFINADNNFDVAALINARPFAFFEGLPALQYFNIGGSVLAGQQFEPRIPPILRLNVPTTANAAIGVPFLAFEPGVLESGQRALWSLHASWYYQQLSLIAEWQSGGEHLALPETPRARTRVPVQSFYVQAGYFLTGETVSARGMVEPRRPFDLRQGQRGPGALELAFRYNLLDVGNEIFTGGFANQALWTDQVQTIDIGLNWYLTRYVKIYTGWQQGIFGSPVLFDLNPNRYQLTSDLFWLRFQVFF